MRIIVGAAFSKLTAAARCPHLLSDVIISHPLRGKGTAEDPIYSTVVLSTTDGDFICEIYDYRRRGA